MPNAGHLHPARRVSSSLQEYQAGLTARTADAMGTAWQYADGGVLVPDAPGLGVEVSEEQLAPWVVRR